MDKTYDYLPFGDELGGFYPGDSSVRGRESIKFTSKERDAETGLDFFLARYYSGAQGRFTSPDEWAGGIVDPFTGGQVGTPGPLPYADITDPQTLNKYAYVRNNPMRYIDPDGHDETSVLELTMEEVDKVVKPLIESAEKKASEATFAGSQTLGLVVAFFANPTPAGGQAEVKYEKEIQRRTKEYEQQQQQQQRVPGTPSPGPPQPKSQDEEEEKEHTKGARKSTWDKHSGKRPGKSQPPGYTPFRKFRPPKKKAEPPPPYHRKDRDPPPPKP